MKIDEIPELMRPREKAQHYGMNSLSDRELLALLIRNGVKDISALEIADKLLYQSHGINLLSRVTYEELIQIHGLKHVKALEILAVVEIAKRMWKPEQAAEISITDNRRLMEWLNIEIGHEKQEHFMVVFLNNQNHILRYLILFKGTVDRSIVHPRDVFREAVSLNATRIILVHNHPGKTMKASREDLRVTHVMIEAGRLLGIGVLDHLIVSFGSYYSIHQEHPELFE